MTVTAPSDLVLDIGHGRHHNTPCALCARDEVDWTATFGIALKGAGRVCEDCAEKHMPEDAHRAMEWFLEALAALDMAVYDAPEYLRPMLLGNVIKVVERLGRHYAKEENRS